MCNFTYNLECAIYLLSIRLFLKILLTRICTSFTPSITSRLSTFKYVFPSRDFVDTVPLTRAVASPKRAWNVPFPLAGKIINTPELQKLNLIKIYPF